MLISRILVDRIIDLYKYRPILINATYDSLTFSSMGYAEVGNKWVKKDFVQERVEADKPSKIFVDLEALLLRDLEELKTRSVDSKLFRMLLKSVFPFERY